MTKETAFKRFGGRESNALRPIGFRNHIAPQATGSTLIEWGQTRVICATTIEEKVPRWMKEQKVEGGWLAAEYTMLPYSTPIRKQRDIVRGRIDGRSLEIQRLIGRSMRAAVDLKTLGPRTIWIDCDVIQANGGTRSASITGAYVALCLAIEKLISEKILDKSPIRKAIAAVSVGIVNGTPLLDLDYKEDAAAAVDLNIVMTSENEYVEVQGAAEQFAFGRVWLNEMLELAQAGIAKLSRLQATALTKP